MSAAFLIDQVTTAATCRDCGAGPGEDCDTACASAIAYELEAEANYEPPCCPNAQVAAARLCGCWGAPGAWIGSAA